MKPHVVTLSKQFTFEAAHRISVFPANHKCHRLHGHSYVVDLVLVGPIEVTTGILVDYADLQTIWDEQIDVVLDHRFLNDIPGLEIPSTENLAAWIAERLSPHFQIPVRPDSPTVCTLLERVRVKEAFSTWCEVFVDDLVSAGRTNICSWGRYFGRTP